MTPSLTVHRVSALITALALAAAGCSSSGSGEGSGQDLEQLSADVDATGDVGIGKLACDLLTIDEIKAAGFTLESDLTVVGLPSEDECKIEVADAELGAAPLTISVYDEAAAVLLGPDLYSGTEVVTGIGIEAWYVDDLSLAQARLADGRVVSIQDVADEARRDGLVSLLETAVSRAG